MVSQTNNSSQFSLTVDSSHPKRSRIEHRNVTQNDFFKRTKINLDIINISRSFLTIKEFVETLLVCKEWNGVSLKDQYCRFMSAVPERIDDILNCPYFYPIPEDDFITLHKSLVHNLPKSWDEAFYLGISKVASLYFENHVKENLRLSILEKSKQLKVFSTLYPTSSEIQVISKIPTLQEVKLYFSSIYYNSEINIMPIFQHNSLKKLTLDCHHNLFKNELDVKEYGLLLEDLKIKTIIIKNKSHIPNFTFVVKKLPALKKLTLEMGYPHLAEISDAFLNLQELHLINMDGDQIEALSRAYSLEKLTFTNCFISEEIEQFQKLYDILSNLPKFKKVSIECAHKYSQFIKLNNSNLAKMTEATIWIYVKDLFDVNVNVKKMFLNLVVNDYSDFSKIADLEFISLIINQDLIEIHLDFFNIDVEPDVKEQENIIKFFQKFARYIHSVENIGDLLFIQEYLKKNPLPNCLIKE